MLDPFGSLVSLLVCIGVGLSALLAPAFLRGRHAERGEFYALLLFAGAGMSLLGLSNELILLFINLEILSVATYALAAYLRRGPRPAEAGFKYFILGAFSSAVLLYGTSLLFGATRSTLLPQMGAELARIFSDPTLADRRPLAYCGLALIGTGFGFKIAAVPFHMWTPDVYEGAPTPVTAMMSAAVKAAAFAAMVRVFLVLGHGIPGDALLTGFSMLAFLTMIVGNLLALPQRNVKRMLAYSSISHAGYLLVGVASLFVRSGTTRTGGVLGVTALAAGATPDTAAALRAILFYLLAYTVTTVGVVRGARGAGAEGRRGARLRLGPGPAGGPGAAQAGLGPGDGGVHALARRHPADGWLHGEAAHLPGGGGRRAGGPGHRRRAHQRGGRVLLPARGGLHVHAAGARGRRAARAELLHRAGAGAEHRGGGGARRAPRDHHHLAVARRSAVPRAVGALLSGGARPLPHFSADGRCVRQRRRGLLRRMTAPAPTTFAAVLRAELTRRCARNPSYSLRAFARALEVDHASLSQILRGRRTLTRETIEQLGARLALPREAIEAHVRDAEAARQGAPTASAALDAAAILAEPLHHQLLALTHTEDFRGDSRFLAQVLDTTPDAINVLLQRLLRFGLLRMNEGRWLDVTGAGELDPDGFERAVWEHAAARVSAEKSPGPTAPAGPAAAPHPVRQFQILARDPEATARFYQQLFGWQVHQSNALGYRQISTGPGGLEGGIWPTPPEGKPLVQLFIESGEIEDSVGRARALGAQVVVPPQALPEGDSLAILVDPEGRPFAVYSPAVST